LSSWPAIGATAVALALINVGLAALIVEIVGARSIAPPWVGLALLLVGTAAAVWAVLLWRRYLADVGQR
jgi:hypothetical protein